MQQIGAEYKEIDLIFLQDFGLKHLAESEIQKLAMQKLAREEQSIRNLIAMQENEDKSTIDKLSTQEVIIRKIREAIKDADKKEAIKKEIAKSLKNIDNFWLYDEDIQENYLALIINQLKEAAQNITISQIIFPCKTSEHKEFLEKYNTEFEQLKKENLEEKEHNKKRIEIYIRFLEEAKNKKFFCNEFTINYSDKEMEKKHKKEKEQFLKENFISFFNIKLKKLLEQTEQIKEMDYDRFILKDVIKSINTPNQTYYSLIKKISNAYQYFFSNKTYYPQYYNTTNSEEQNSNNNAQESTEKTVQSEPSPTTNNSIKNRDENLTVKENEELMKSKKTEEQRTSNSDQESTVEQTETLEPTPTTASQPLNIDDAIFKYMEFLFKKTTTDYKEQKLKESELEENHIREALENNIPINLSIDYYTTDDDTLNLKHKKEKKQLEIEQATEANNSNINCNIIIYNQMEEIKQLATRQRNEALEAGINLSTEITYLRSRNPEDTRAQHLQEKHEKEKRDLQNAQQREATQAGITISMEQINYENKHKEMKIKHNKEKLELALKQIEEAKQIFFVRHSILYCMIKIHYDNQHQEMKEKHEKAMQELNLRLIQKENIEFKININYTNQHQEMKQKHEKEIQKLKLEQIKEAEQAKIRISKHINYTEHAEIREKHEKEFTEIGENYYNYEQISEIETQLNQMECSEEEKKHI